MSLTKRIYKQHREELQAVQDAPVRDKLRVSIEMRLRNLMLLVGEDSEKLCEAEEAEREIDNAYIAVRRYLERKDELTGEIPF